MECLFMFIKEEVLLLLLFFFLGRVYNSARVSTDETLTMIGLINFVPTFELFNPNTYQLSQIIVCMSNNLNTFFPQFSSYIHNVLIQKWQTAAAARCSTSGQFFSDRKRSKQQLNK